MKRLLVTVSLLALVGCGGGDGTAAREASERLRDALITPDAATVRSLVVDRSSSISPDLLTPEIVADNAFAGRDVGLDADVSRYNDTGTFTLEVDDPPARLAVAQRLSEKRTPGALPRVTLRSDRPLSSVRVNGHVVPVDVPAGSETAFWLPPGSWTLEPPTNPYATSSPVRVDLRTDRSGRAGLRSTLSASGRTEAVRRADAFLAECAQRHRVDESSACFDGATRLCVGQATYATTRPAGRVEWIVGDDLTIRSSDAVRRTTTTECVDGSGAAVDRSTRSTSSAYSGRVVLTDDGLDVRFP